VQRTTPPEDRILPMSLADLLGKRLFYRKSGANLGAFIGEINA
jgi:hypothetical protein